MAENMDPWQAVAKNQPFFYFLADLSFSVWSLRHGIYWFHLRQARRMVGDAAVMNR